MNADFVAFFPVALALVMSPGPDSILVLRNTLTGGRRPGYLTVAGVQVGVVAHGLLAAFGLSALLYYSETLFRALSFAGALYLAWLGWLSIRSRGAILDGAAVAPPQAVASPQATDESGSAFRRGMVCNLLNPKVIILFVALMPAFVDLSAGSGVVQIFLLTGILLAINIPFQIFLVVAARFLRAPLSRPLPALVIRSLLGGVLLFFSATIFINHVLREAGK